MSAPRTRPSPRKLAADRRRRRDRIVRVLDRLGERYDHPRWSEPRLDPVSELVLTILSQNTSDTNSARAFALLRSAYPDWDAVLAAPTGQVADVIRPGGLANIKSARIQRVLAEVRDATASTPYDLSFLASMPLDQGKAWLAGLPGIGPKTAAIVLLFGFGRPALPVDTHVFRVATRLGLLPPRTDVVRAHSLLEASLEPDEVYPFHVELIRHGREVCNARRPACEACPLTDVCVYFQKVVSRAPIPRGARRAASEVSDPAAWREKLLHGALPPR
ncbi:MAG: endonuclease III [Chloroflexota bacterium]